MKPQLTKRSRVIVGAVSAPLLLVGVVGTAASSPAAPPQMWVPSAPIDDQVQAADSGLKAAKHALAVAQETLDEAAEELPKAQEQVQQALAASAAAQAAETRARAAVVSAQKAVAAQRVKISKTQGEIDALKDQIAWLARQAYTSAVTIRSWRSCWSPKIQASSPRNCTLSVARLAATRRPLIKS